MERIVIVPGSFQTKCGLDDYSHNIFLYGKDAAMKECEKPIMVPTILGKEKIVEGPLGMLMMNRMGFGTPVPEGWVGDEAIGKRGILRLLFPIPISENTPVNMKYFHSVLIQCVKRELRHHYDEKVKTRIIIADLPIMRKSYYKPICESFTEEYSEILCEEFSILSPSFLALYQTGLKTAACVVDIGHSRSSATCFDEKRKVVTNSACFTRLGGVHISQNLLCLLYTNGFLFDKPLEKKLPKGLVDELLTSLKHKRCFVREEIFDGEKYSSKPVKFGYCAGCGEDGKPEIDVFECTELEISQCCEILFSPEKFMSGDKKIQESREINDHLIENIQDMIERSILRSPYHLRKELLENIVIFGGTSKIKGLNNRIRNLLMKKFPSFEIEIHHDHEKCEYLDFLGGCKFSRDYPEDDPFFVKKEEYKEQGMEIVEKKLLCKKNCVSFIMNQKSIIWTPENHKFHDLEFKKIVMTVLCASELRSDCLLYRIPKEVVLMIISFLNRKETTNEKLRERLSYIKCFNFNFGKRGDGLLFHKFYEDY